MFVHRSCSLFIISVKSVLLIRLIIAIMIKHYRQEQMHFYRMTIGRRQSNTNSLAYLQLEAAIQRVHKKQRFSLKV